MHKSLNLFPESEDQDKVIDLKKVTIKEPAPLDIDFFINEHKNGKRKISNHQKTKAKPKQEKTSSKNYHKPIIEVPLQKLKKYSLHMICSFKKILQEKFNSSVLSELDRQRKSNLEKLFPYVCFGLQQCFQQKSFEPSEETQIQQISQVSFDYLKKIVFQIDQKLLKIKNGNKKTSPNFKFKNQWNFLFDLIKDLGNYRIRCGIINKKIKPKQLAYANEADLKEYLSEERQKKLESEAQRIVRISENDDLKLHFDLKAQSKDFDSDDKTTVMSDDKGKMEEFQQCKWKRSKSRTKQGEKMQAYVKRGKKVRKLNETLMI